MGGEFMVTRHNSAFRIPNSPGGGEPQPQSKRGKNEEENRNANERNFQT